MLARSPYPLALAALCTMLLAACASEPDTPAEATAVQTTAAAADLPDTTGAAVWAYLQEVDYRSSWALWPDKGELYTGQEPHGMLLTTYLNTTAMEALQGDAAVMPPGAILVKENYTPDSTLAAVTVMYKVTDYNPDHNDWFFSKHLADGALDTTPNGAPMEGRLAGCQNCHGAQQANDYIFTGNLQ